MRGGAPSCCRRKALSMFYITPKTAEEGKTDEGAELIPNPEIGNVGETIDKNDHTYSYYKKPSSRRRKKGPEEKRVVCQYLKSWHLHRVAFLTDETFVEHLTLSQVT